MRHEFNNDHLAYMALLVDSYEFTSTCLERQIEDVNSLENGASLATQPPVACSVRSVCRVLLLIRPPCWL